MDRKYAIYCIRFVGGGRSYIGSAVDLKLRLYQHRRLLRIGKHHCIGLQRAYAKYGKAKMVVSILANGTSRDDILQLEQAWIDANKDRLYNSSLLAIPSWSKKKTPEQVEKSAKHHRGKIVRPDTRARLSAAAIGNTNGSHSARPFCGAGHKMEGENLYFYRVSTGARRRACRQCQATNNLRQHLRRYPNSKKGELVCLT